MEIRQIENHEIDQIKGLWNELKQHHQDRTVDYSEYYLANNFSKRKAELLAKDRIAIFIAENGNGEKIGFCIVSTIGSQGEVDSLYVKLSQRKYNLGKALMDEGMQWLSTYDLNNISLSVGQGNEAVLSFYEKLGFRKRSIVMEFFE